MFENSIASIIEYQDVYGRNPTLQEIRSLCEALNFSKALDVLMHLLTNFSVSEEFASPARETQMECFQMGFRTRYREFELHRVAKYVAEGRIGISRSGLLLSLSALHTWSKEKVPYNHAVFCQLQLLCNSLAYATASTYLPYSVSIANSENERFHHVRDTAMYLYFICDYLKAKMINRGLDREWNRFYSEYKHYFLFLNWCFQNYLGGPRRLVGMNRDNSQLQLDLESSLQYCIRENFDDIPMMTGIDPHSIAGLLECTRDKLIRKPILKRPKVISLFDGRSAQRSIKNGIRWRLKEICGSLGTADSILGKSFEEFLLDHLYRYVSKSNWNCCDEGGPEIYKTDSQCVLAIEIKTGELNFVENNKNGMGSWNTFVEKYVLDKGIPQLLSLAQKVTQDAPFVSFLVLDDDYDTGFFQYELWLRWYERNFWQGTRPEFEGLVTGSARVICPPIIMGHRAFLEFGKFFQKNSILHYVVKYFHFLSKYKLFSFSCWMQILQGFQPEEFSETLPLAKQTLDGLLKEH